MREYEFKGKRLDDGEWVHGSYCACGICADKRDMQYAWPLVTETMSVGVISAQDFGGIKVDSSTVCQYIGQLDKNNNKIYENDIVKTIHYRFPMIVKWCDKTASFRLFGLTDYSINAMGDLEVIGNIHDEELTKK